MNEYTVNIDDFRCRASNPRAARTKFRSANPSAELSLVESKSDAGRTVYDISEARQAQRIRTRLTFRPMGGERRSNVLRFRTSEPILMAVPAIDQPREKFRGITDGPVDLPPAA